MKHLYFFFTFIVISVTTFSQNPIRGSFTYENNVYNYEFRKESDAKYALEISDAFTQNEQSGNTTSSDETPDVEELKNELAEEKKEETEKDDQKKNSSESFLFSEFNKEIFVGAFTNKLCHTIKKTTATMTADDTTKIRDLSLEIFFKIKTRLDFIDDEPITGYAFLCNKSAKTYLKYNTSVYYRNKRISHLIEWYPIKTVSIEMEFGFIKNIIVIVKSTSSKTNQELTFKNTYPISLSGKFDPDLFSKIKLYCIDCGGIKRLSRYIQLQELIKVDIILKNGREDYSSAPSTIELSPTHPIIELKKEKRSKILTVNTFSDLQGLQSDLPNGLIQIEASRRINLNTKHYPVRNNGIQDIPDQIKIKAKTPYSTFRIKKNKFTYVIEKKDLPPSGYTNLQKHHCNCPNRVLNALIDSLDNNDSTKTKNERRNAVCEKIHCFSSRERKFSFAYINFLGYLEPSVLFAKLDDNNRFLAEPTSTNKITPVNLFRYQLTNLGLRLHLFSVHFPQTKINWEVANVGAHWFKTKLDDGSDDAYTLNNSYYFINTNFYFRPDHNWGLSVGGSYIKLSIWNNDYRISGGGELLQSELNGFLKTNDVNKIFFRFRWTSELGNKDRNFSQIQVGYNMNLFSNNEKK